MSAPAFLDSISPWTSKANTPKSGYPKGDGERTPAGGPIKQQQGTDHHVSLRQRVSQQDYPDDCPPLTVRWFYAIDVPKRKPNKLPGVAKPLPSPKKFVSFSARDSRSIESAFQKLAEEERSISKTPDLSGDTTKTTDASGRTVPVIETQIDTTTGSNDPNKSNSVKVSVNEDFLFDVEIDSRELAPAYWLGPVYDVRRASWFYQDGTSSRPCEENLASQLEEGYIRAKPWRYESSLPIRSASQPKQRPSSLKSDDDLGKFGAIGIKPPRMPSADDSRNRTKEENQIQAPTIPKFQLQTHRLFGTYMNTVVTYQDATVAWLLTDDFLSRMSSTVYQRFAGGGHLGGMKLVRGYTENIHGKESKPEADLGAELKDSDERGRVLANPKRRSAPPSVDRGMIVDVRKAQNPEPELESKKATLERRMATIIASPSLEDPALQEEELRKRDENEIKDDYRDADKDDQGRDIEHLILVTHGIGQRLGLKMETVNFIHDVNVLRKTLKTVYEGSPDLQALNVEVEKLPKNCRVQVLPVVWRHLLDFPKQSLKQNQKEQDLTDADIYGDVEQYPSLTDITIEGVPAVRNLITDLALDILLYQSAYREHIAGIVQRECNRVYNLFRKRNPQFNGKISLVGHSLGSAIMFDVLCRQKVPDTTSAAANRASRSGNTKPAERGDLSLDFEVEDFFCLGSPLGLFQMLKGRTIAGRQASDSGPAQSPLDPDSLEDPFLGPYAPGTGPKKTSRTEILSIAVSSPKCAQLFNIFHPSDPIAYRLEPLISPAMSSLKPQPLPYIKRSIFGVPGLTGIGARVGQSVSGLWSNITTGVASSLLNRSLGLTHDEPLAPTQNTTVQTRTPLSLGAGTNIAASGVVAGPEALEEERKKAATKAEIMIAGGKTMDGAQLTIEHPTTLLDTEIETLYSGHHKRRKSLQSDEGRDQGESAEWQEADNRAKRLRREEEKVRALNSNGRVDYSIQEGVFDISLIASIASHLSYWADEDVSHFMISQLLSKQRVVKHGQ